MQMEKVGARVEVVTGVRWRLGRRGPRGVDFSLAGEVFFRGVSFFDAATA
jgi:hypothetical protein